MLEIYDLPMHVYKLVVHVHAFNIELQFHIIDLLSANMDEF